MKKKYKMTDEEYAEFERQHLHWTTRAWQNWRLYLDEAKAGLSAEEIATKYNEPIETVKYYLTRAEP